MGPGKLQHHDRRSEFVSGCSCRWRDALLTLQSIHLQLRADAAAWMQTSNSQQNSVQFQSLNHSDQDPELVTALLDIMIYVHEKHIGQDSGSSPWSFECDWKPLAVAKRS